MDEGILSAPYASPMDEDEDKPASLREGFTGLAWSLSLLGAIALSEFGGHGLGWRITGAALLTILIISTVLRVFPTAAALKGSPTGDEEIAKPWQRLARVLARCAAVVTLGAIWGAVVIHWADWELLFWASAATWAAAEGLLGLARWRRSREEGAAPSR